MEVGHSLVLMGNHHVIKSQGNITDGESQSPKKARCEVWPSDLERFDTIDHLPIDNKMLKKSSVLKGQ